MIVCSKKGTVLEQVQSYMTQNWSLDDITNDVLVYMGNLGSLCPYQPDGLNIQKIYAGIAEVFCFQVPKIVTLRGTKKIQPLDLYLKFNHTKKKAKLTAMCLLCLNLVQQALLKESKNI